MLIAPMQCMHGSNRRKKLISQSRQVKTLIPFEILKYARIKDFTRVGESEKKKKHVYQLYVQCCHYDIYFFYYFVNGGEKGI